VLAENENDEKENGESYFLSLSRVEKPTAGAEKFPELPGSKVRNP